MRNLIIGVLIAGAFAYFGTKWKLHHDIESGVDMAVMMMSPFAVVQYDGVSSTMTGELTIDGIRGRVKGFNDEFFIAKLGIDTPSFLSLMKLGDVQSLVTSGDDVFPKYFGLIVEGLRMPSNADYGYKLHEEQIKQRGVSDADEPANECTGKYGLSPGALLAMGYTEYDLSFSARFRQLGNRYAVEIETSSKDMWEVDAELILVGNMATELAKGQRYRPKMGEMRVEYVDRSLKERIAQYCRTQGLTDDEILEAQLDAFRHFGSESGIEFDEYVIEPYKEFLAGKSTLVVTAKPNEPVTISQITLYKPSDVPALLQLSAEAH